MNKIIALIFALVFLGCKKHNKIELFESELKLNYPNISQYNQILLLPTEGCSDCILRIIDDCNKSKQDSFFILITGRFNIDEVLSLVEDRFEHHYFATIDNYFLNNKHKISYSEPLILDLKKN